MCLGTLWLTYNIIRPSPIKKRGLVSIVNSYVAMVSLAKCVNAECKKESSSTLGLVFKVRLLTHSHIICIFSIVG